MRKRNFTVIKRSCITGEVVWIYQGTSKATSLLAYWRACRNEVENERHRHEREAERRSAILRMMNDCMAGIPINAELTPRQKKAVQRMKQIMNDMPSKPSAFYEHIMEERRRRAEDREIRRQMRERAQREKEQTLDKIKK